MLDMDEGAVKFFFREQEFRMDGLRRNPRFPFRLAIGLQGGCGVRLAKNYVVAAMS